MPKPSEESHELVVSLTRRVGPNPDAAAVAQAIISILQDIDSSLTPILGPQGVAALYRRSLHLCLSNHPHLASVYAELQASLDLTALQAVLVEQSAAEAMFFGEVLLITFHELLTTLIGSSLTSRLLRGVWEPSPSEPPAQEESP